MSQAATRGTARAPTALRCYDILGSAKEVARPKQAKVAAEKYHRSISRPFPLCGGTPRSALPFGNEADPLTLATRKLEARQHPTRRGRFLPNSAYSRRMSASQHGAAVLPPSKVNRGRPLGSMQISAGPGFLCLEARIVKAAPRLTQGSNADQRRKKSGLVSSRSKTI
jgi:hypothetical protein